MSKASHAGPPFRADHVGSLLRPPVLRRAYGDFAAGRLSPDAFGDIQDRAIREVVALQEGVGLKSVTDGEFRRASYWAHFVEAIDGFTVKPAIFRFHDAAGSEQEFLAPHVESRISRPRSISGGEFDFLRSVTAQTPKITMPSPPTLHFWRGRDGVDHDAYPDIEAFFADLGRVYREEIADLAARGARYLQIDEVPIAMLCDSAVCETLAAQGVDAARLMDRYVALINDCVAARPEGVTLTMHLCRGNFKGRWLSEGGYEGVAEKLFNEIDVDAFFLEYDSPRAGDFAPLRFVPKGRAVVLGLVSSKTPVLESRDDLKRRIDEASNHLPLAQLALSPQCGFASTVAGNPITEDDEVRKLALIVEVAAQVWGD